MPLIDAVQLLGGIPQELRTAARSLLCHVLQINEAQLHGRRDICLSDAEEKAWQQLVQKLKDGVPLSRIVGKREFWSLDFVVNEATLDPRPDSEVLVETVLRHTRLHKLRDFRILDLGTGTGCLMLSLLKELPQAHGVAVDVSARALEAAAQNAHVHGVSDRLQLVQSNWLESVEGSFDIIISNPPYIASDEMTHLDDNVKKFDPLQALDGGDDGLEAYRAILAGLHHHMNATSVGFFEIGWQQANQLSQLLNGRGYHVQEVVQDLEKRDRVVVFNRVPAL